MRSTDMNLKPEPSDLARTLSGRLLSKPGKIQGILDRWQPYLLTYLQFLFFVCIVISEHGSLRCCIQQPMVLSQHCSWQTATFNANSVSTAVIDHSKSRHINRILLKYLFFIYKLSLSFNTSLNWHSVN